MISKNVLSLRTFFEIILDNNATKFGSKRFARNVDSDYLPHNIPDSELGHGVIFIVHQSLHCLRRELKQKTKSFISCNTFTSIFAFTYSLFLWTNASLFSPMALLTFRSFLFLLTAISTLSSCNIYTVLSEFESPGHTFPVAHLSNIASIHISRHAHFCKIFNLVFFKILQGKMSPTICDFLTNLATSTHEIQITFDIYDI